MKMYRVIAAMALVTSLPLHAVIFNPADFGVKTDFKKETFLPDQVPGENIDPRTGSLSWQIQEGVVTAYNGMTFPIIRSYGAGQSGPKHFANWDIDLPRVVITTHPPAKNIGEQKGGSACDNKGSPGWRAWDKSTTGVRNWDFAILSIPAQGTMPMIPRRADDGRFPSDAKWLTTENWYVSCLPAGGGFLAVSPNGEKYHLTERSHVPGHWVSAIASSTGHIAYYVSKIENQFGDELKFSYDDVYGSPANMPGRVRRYIDANIHRPHRPFLTSISTKVNHRTSNSDPNYVPLLSVDYSLSFGTSSYNFVSGINFLTYQNFNNAAGFVTTENFSTVRKIAYQYSDDKPISDYCHFIVVRSARDACRSGAHIERRLLEKAHYPDSTVSEYTYKGPITGSTFDAVGALGSYPGLSSLRHRSGIEINYFYEQRHPAIWDAQLDKVSGVDLIPVISRRMIKDIAPILVTLPTYETVYDYALVNNETHSIITRDNKVEEHFYYRIPGNHDVSLNRRAALLREKVTYAKQPAFNERPIHEKYTYTFIPYGVTTFGGKDGISTWKQLQANVVTGVFSKESHYDEYGFPLIIMEKNDVTNWQRRIDQEYTHPYLASGGKHFILGGLTSQSIDRKVIYSAIYNWLGMPLWEQSGGKIQEKTYLTRVSGGGFGEDNSVVPAPGNTGQVASIEWEADKLYGIRLSDYIASSPQRLDWSDGAYEDRVIDTEGKMLKTIDHRGFEQEFSYDIAGRMIERLESEVDGVKRDVSISWIRPHISYEYSGGQRTIRHFLGTGQVYLEANTDLVSGGPTISLYTKYDRFGNKIYAEGSLARTPNPFLEPVVKPISVNEYTIHGTLASESHSPIGLTHDYCHNWIQVCVKGSSPEPVIGKVLIAESSYMQSITSTSSALPGTPGRKVVKNMYGFSLDQLKENAVRIFQGEDEIRKISVRYDGLLNPQHVTIDGISRTYQYGSHGELLAEYNPESGKKEYGYYSDGNISFIRHGSGRLEEFSYSDRGLLEGITIDGQLIQERKYLPGGDLEIARNQLSGVALRYSYLANGLLSSEITNVDGASYEFLYAYDADGNLVSAKYPSGKQYDFSTTSRGWVTRIEGIYSAFSYETSGQANHYRLGDMTTVSRKFAPDGRLLSMTAGQTVGDIYKRDYRYDGFGNLASITNPFNRLLDIQNSFDQMDRLVASSGPWGVHEFDYDNKDNLLSISSDKGGILHIDYDDRNLPHSAISPNAIKPIDHDLDGRIIKYGDLYISYYSDGLVESVGNPSGKIFYRHDPDGNNTVLDDRRSGVKKLLIRSTPLNAVAHEINMHTGISSDHIYADMQRVARVDLIPDIDSDNDGIPDAIEKEMGLNPHNAGDAHEDSDGDGLTNLQEYSHGANPFLLDTDGDGIADGLEVASALNPLVADAYLDNDGDGLLNIDEVAQRTDPNNPDSDGDGLLDDVDPKPLFHAGAELVIRNYHIMSP